MLSVSTALSQTPAYAATPWLVHRTVPVYNPAFAGTKLYCLVTEAYMGVKNLPKVVTQTVWRAARDQTNDH